MISPNLFFGEHFQKKLWNHQLRYSITRLKNACGPICGDGFPQKTYRFLFGKRTSGRLVIVSLCWKKFQNYCPGLLDITWLSCTEAVRHQGWCHILIIIENTRFWRFHEVSWGLPPWRSSLYSFNYHATCGTYKPCGSFKKGSLVTCSPSNRGKYIAYVILVFQNPPVIPCKVLQTPKTPHELRKKELKNKKKTTCMG